MSACVIWPIFCSSVIPATIARTRDSRAASGRVLDAALGQVWAAVAADATTAAARYRRTPGRPVPPLGNANIRTGLEVVASAEEPRATVLFDGFQRPRSGRRI